MLSRVRGNGIDAKGFVSFVHSALDVGVRPRAIRYFKDGEMQLAADFAPFATDERIRVYSMSKAFTSAAVGIAVGEGALSVDDKICDIFPQYIPSDADERLKKMTLHHLLSMQSGHERCHLDRMIQSRHSVEAFLSQPVAYEPGTTFVYSTAGTLMCGAAVTARTGIPLDEYVNEKLLSPLGIKDAEWDKTPDGICFGGIGLHVNADDVLEFGRLMLDGGRGIIPKEYIDLATTAHSVDKNNGSADWISGYGYQFWLNSRGGYRADGAYGQLCIVDPEKQSVFVILAEATNMQDEMDVIHAFLSDYTPGRGDVSDALKLAETLYKPENSSEKTNGTVYRFEKNPYHIASARLSASGDILTVDLDCDHGTQHMECGNGEYIHNSFCGFNMMPAIAQLKEHDVIDRINVYAAFDIKDGEINITMRHSDAPHTQYWRFASDGLHISTYVGDLPSRFISLA